MAFTVHVQGTNKHFPTSTVSVIVPVSAVRANRPHILLQLGSRTTFSALFDTGACVSLISRRAFRTAQQAGAVGQEIHNHGVTLQTASGDPLPSEGAFHITFSILGRSVTAPVLVATQLNTEFLVGMNIINQEGIMYDPRRQ